MKRYRYNKRLRTLERYWHIPMPWTDFYWDFANDLIRHGRKSLLIIWSANRLTGLHIRIGWAYKFHNDIADRP